MFEFPPEMIADAKPYYICVHRAEKPRSAEVYAIDLRDRLPVVEVPLRAGEAGVKFDLQPLLDRVYRNGRFPIDSTKPCDPPLAGVEAGFAAEILKLAAV
jgi:hypothetical protein